MKAEEMLSIIKSSGAKVINEDEFMQLDANLNLIRTLEVSALICDMKFTWWSNVIEIDINHALIRVDSINASSSWPNKFKMNINATRSGEVVAVIPTKE